MCNADSPLHGFYNAFSAQTFHMGVPEEEAEVKLLCFRLVNRSLYIKLLVTHSSSVRKDFKRVRPHLKGVRPRLRGREMLHARHRGPSGPTWGRDPLLVTDGADCNYLRVCANGLPSHAISPKCVVADSSKWKCTVRPAVRLDPAEAMSEDDPLPAQPLLKGKQDVKPLLKRTFGRLKESLSEHTPSTLLILSLGFGILAGVVAFVYSK